MAMNWLLRLVGVHTSSRRRARARRPKPLLPAAWKPRIELLEERLTPSGDFGYALALGGSGTSAGQEVATDSAGNVYVAGTFTGTIDANPGPGTSSLQGQPQGSGAKDAFVAKYSPAGALVWAQQLGGANVGGSGLQLGGLGVDSSQNVYLMGYFGGTMSFGANSLTGADTDNIFVTKLDSNGGTFDWAKQFACLNSEAFGTALAVDSSGNVDFTGEFSGPVDFDRSGGNHNLTSTGLVDTFVSQLNSADGTVRWVKQYGGSNAQAQPGGLAVDGQGNVYTTGQFTDTVNFNPGGSAPLTSLGDTAAFVAKLDGSGNFGWATQFGGANSGSPPVSNWGQHIVVDGTGDVYTTGTFNGTVNFPTSSSPVTLTSAGQQDAYLAKLNSDGTAAWAQHFATTGSSFVGAPYLAPGPSGSVYLTTPGFTGGVVKLDGSGNQVWARQLPALTVAADTSGDIFVSGILFGTQNLDPTPNQAYDLTGGNGGSAFAVKLLDDHPAPAVAVPASSTFQPVTTNEDSALSFPGTISVSEPNPNVSSLTVALAAVNGKLTLETENNLTGVTGDGTASVSFSGSVAAINAALNGLTYTPDTHYGGPDTLTVTAGDGTALGANVVLLSVTPNLQIRLPGFAANVLENGQFTFSSPNNSITLADTNPGVATNGLTVTLSLSQTGGKLTLAQNSGVTNVTGDGTNSVTFTGLLNQVNAALNGLSYAPPSDFTGTDVLTVQANDNTNTDSQTFDLNVTALLITAPASVTTKPGAAVTFTSANGNPISVTDVANPSSVTLTISANSGTVTLAAGSGVHVTQGTGTNDSSVTFSGTLAQVNAALDGLQYTPAQSATGNASDALFLNASDNLNNQNSQGVGVLISSPMQIFGVTPVSVLENSSLTFTNFGFNSLTIQDPSLASNALVTVTLSVSAQNGGKLALPGTSGIQFVNGQNNSASLTFTGTLTQVNAALAGLVYTPGHNYLGADPISVSATAGNDSGSLTIDLSVVALLVQVPPNGVFTTANTNLVLSNANHNAVTVADLGAGTAVTVTLQASHGTLTIPGGTGVNVTTGTGTGDATMTFGGMLAQVNAALNGLIYSPNTNYTGQDTLKVTAGDASDSPSSSTQSLAVIVQSPLVIFAPFQSDVLENGSLTFLGSNSVGVSESSDLSGQTTITMTLSASHGTLSFGSVSGLTFDNSTQNGQGALAFHGTLSAVNAAFSSGLVYAPAANYTGPDTLNFGAGDGTFSATSQTSLSVVPFLVMAPPSTGTGSATPLHFTAASFNAISVGDIDPNATVTITLSVTQPNSTLSVSDASAQNVNFLNNTHNGSASLNFTGSLSNVNAALASLVYTPPAGFAGQDSLSVSAQDSNSRNYSKSIFVTVFPSVAVVAPSQAGTTENTNLTFANATQIRVSDPTASPSTQVTVSLSVSHGVLTLSTTQNLQFNSPQNGSAALNFTGALSDVNAALDGLVYAPSANYVGPDNLFVSANDSDGGASQTVSLSVTSSAPPPVITAPASGSLDEGTTLTFSGAGVISVADAHPGATALTVSLQVSHGALTLAGTAGLTFTTGTGQGDATVQFTGTLSAVNAALNGLVYTPTAGYLGADLLTVSAGDGTNSASPQSVALTVRAVPPPSITAPGSATTTQDTSISFAGNNAINVAVPNPDATSLSASLSVGHGTLTLPTTQGLTFNNGTANGGPSLNFTGSISNVNAGLNGLTYAPAAGYTGPDALSVAASDGVHAAVPQTVSLLVNSPAPPSQSQSPPPGSQASVTVGPDDNLQAAIDSVAPGGSITLEPGTYAQGFVLDKPVILKGSGSGSTVITGSGSGTGMTITAPGAALSGITVSGFAVGINVSNTSFLQLDDVHLTGNRWGGEISNVAVVLINGGSSNDTFYVEPGHVDRQGENPVDVNGAKYLTLNAGAGHNRLVVDLDDGTGPSTIWINGSGISRAGAAPFLLFYQATGGDYASGIALVLGNNSHTVIVQGQPQGIPIAVYGGTGPDWFYVQARSDVSYTNLTLDGGAGIDTFGVFDYSGGAGMVNVVSSPGNGQVNVSYRGGSFSTIVYNNMDVLLGNLPTLEV